MLPEVSNSLNNLHRTPLPPTKFPLRYALPSPKYILIEPVGKSVFLPDEPHWRGGTCRRIQRVLSTILVFSSAGFGARVSFPVHFELWVFPFYGFPPFFHFSRQYVSHYLILSLRNVLIVPQCCANCREFRPEPELWPPLLVQFRRGLRLGWRAY